MKLREDEVCTIKAALHYWRTRHIATLPQEFEDIATKNGHLRRLTYDDIEFLMKKLKHE